ncbi:hypothetical protein AB1Y20_018969 [Prymnesium parvum]|uniref:COX assembly mitochondrial protein n=1 Tax=Prymnesium parvum TaxID=97485 RepID=A0AB34JPY4_PRYPA
MGERGETLDERIARQRAQHSCLKRLDELMYCMTITNQLSKYYRDGQYDNCPERFNRWSTCLKMKLSKDHVALALEEKEWRESVSGEHVFMFKPQYREEAHKRYGVPLPRT